MTVPSPTVTWRPSTHPAMMVTPSLIRDPSPSTTSSPPIATASSRSFMLPPRPSFESGQHHVCDIDAAESDGLLDQDHPQPPPACFIRHRGVDTFIELLFEITTQRSEFLQIRLPAAFQVLFTELPGEQTQIRHHSLLPVIELLLVGEPQHTLVDDPLGVHHPDPRSASGRHEKHTDNERNPSSRSRGVHRFSFSTTSVVMSITATLMTNRVRTTSRLRRCAMP